MPTYELAKNILIPKGTIVHTEPPGWSARYITPHASITLGPSKDTHAMWIMDLQDAIEVGLVREVKAPKTAKRRAPPERSPTEAA